MAVLKCKMCGGDLNIVENTTVAECEYCGSKQTIPVIDDDKKIKLYERANKLRFACDFDKASVVYESIVEEFSDEAEAYWGLVLCKYGIEYVDDPGTGKKVPTCHRSSFDSVMRDENFELVMENADTISLSVYRAEAKAIEEIRKGIIEVSSNEEPYDIFICYKETDENGNRTLDSVLAQDVYEELVEKGYRVFFSRITLEDKIGQEYEPFIFAALNSAKVMLAFGSKYEYYNAVWVKNEWSRFLKLIAAGQKKTLIPCYKNLDAYDMPEEFAKLQAQDMGKVGAIQDLLRGIDKIIGKKEKENVIVQSGNHTNIQALLKRGKLAIEDGDWNKADSFYEEVLNQDAESAEAYLGKLLVMKRCCTLEELSNEYLTNSENEKEEKLQACNENRARIEKVVSDYVVEGYLDKQELTEIYQFDRSYKSKLSAIKKNKDRVLEMINKEKLLIRARQFAVGETKASLDAMIDRIVAVYDKKIADAENHDKKNIENIIQEYEQFLKTGDEKACKKYENAMAKKENDYNELLNQFQNSTTIGEYKNILAKLTLLNGYRDSEIFIKQCTDEIERIETAQKIEFERIRKEQQIEAERRKKEQEQEEERRLAEYEAKVALAKKKRKKIITIICSVIMVCILSVIVVRVVSLELKYNEAEVLVQEGKYEQAITMFTELGNYKDSSEQICATKYMQAEGVRADSQYEQAISLFTELGNYKDSSEQIYITKYMNAETLMAGGQYQEAITIFSSLQEYEIILDDYKAPKDMILECKYETARLTEMEKPIETALFYIENISYLDCRERLLNLSEQYLTECINQGDYSGICDYLVACNEADAETIKSEYSDLLNYAQGMRAMEEGKLPVAMKFFNECKNYMNSNEKYALCDMYDEYCGAWEWKYYVLTAVNKEVHEDEQVGDTKYATDKYVISCDLEIWIPISEDKVFINYSIVDYYEEISEYDETYTGTIEYKENFKIRKGQQEYSVSLKDQTVVSSWYSPEDSSKINSQYTYHYDLP